MKRLFNLFALVLVLSASLTFSQQVKFNLTESNVGEETINRTDSIITIDVNVANEAVVKDIKFNVSASATDASISTYIIPSRPVMADGITTDPSKWTEVIGNSFHYFMNSDPVNWLGVSANSRNIMKFFVKFRNGNIPLTGKITIKFSDITVKGVIAGQEAQITSSDTAAIVIDLGKTPNENSDSVNIKTKASVDSVNKKVDFLISYKSKYALREINFVITAPEDLLNPQIFLAWAKPGRQGTIEDLGGGSYSIRITADNNSSFGASAPDYFGVATISFEIAKEAFGDKEVIFSNVGIKDVGNNALKVNQSFSVWINLGSQIIPNTNDTTVFFFDYSVDRKFKEAYLDIKYLGAGFDSVSFWVELPNNVWIKSIYLENGNYLFEDYGNGIFHISMYSKNKETEIMKNFAKIILGFDTSVVGQKIVRFSNIKYGIKGKIINITGYFDLTIDFGQNPEQPQPSIKYYLVKADEWISPLDSLRVNGFGFIKLNILMDNVVETTGSIQFDIALPDYMELTDVLPIIDYYKIDNTKNISINPIDWSSGMTTYRVVYSAIDKKHPLLPNPRTDNPQPIMQLVIKFTDLPYWVHKFEVDNIISSGLDGRVLNETKQTELKIDFLNDIYLKWFVKGDVNQQFGDGALTSDDVDIMIKIIAKEIVPTLYQQWAGDLNKDGKIDVYDLTILQNMVNGRTSVEDQTAIRIWQAANFINYSSVSENIELNIYDYSGKMLETLKSNAPIGAFDLSNLNSGIYFYKLNNYTGKIFISK